MMLNFYRQQIDLLDRTVLLTLILRFRIAARIGKVKHLVGLGVLDVKREKAVYDKLEEKLSKFKTWLPAEISPTDIWSGIIKSARKSEISIDLLFLGPYGSHSNEAALAFCYFVLNGTPQRILSEVSHLSSNKRLVVLPCANNCSGSVIGSKSSMRSSNVSAVGMIEILIKQQLARDLNQQEKLPVVVSQGYAFGQCKLWINRSGTLSESTKSTSKALALATGSGVHSIASSKAPKFLGSSGIAAVQDQINNRTIFLLVQSKGKSIKKSKRNGLAIANLSCRSKSEIVVLFLMLIESKVAVADLMISIGPAITMLLFSFQKSFNISSFKNLVKTKTTGICF